MPETSTILPAGSPPSVASTTTTAHHTIRPAACITRAREAKKNFAAPAEKRVQATFPIMKPIRSKYVRVHPGADYRLHNILTYTDSDTQEMYYVSPDLELPDSVLSYVKRTSFFAAQTHDKTVFVWFVHHSDTSWFRAANHTVNACVNSWRRVVARKAANTYDMYAPEQQIPEPTWEDLPTFAEMLENAFEDRLITTTDHPVLRKLRGLRDDDE